MDNRERNKIYQKRYRDSAKGKASAARSYAKYKARTRTAEVREQHRLSQQRWRSKPDVKPKLKLRNQERGLSFYGLTLADKQGLWNKQMGLCALCRQPLPTDVGRCHTDHIHGTKIVRGLLHCRCNWLIGWIEKNPSLVQPALDYVARFANLLAPAP